MKKANFSVPGLRPQPLQHCAGIVGLLKLRIFDTLLLFIFYLGREAGREVSNYYLSAYNFLPFFPSI
jgi:hypothetical protein